MLGATDTGMVEIDAAGHRVYFERFGSAKQTLLVAHGVRRVDVVRRQPNGDWLTISAGSGESLELESIGCTLSVDAVYRDPLSQ